MAVATPPLSSRLKLRERFPHRRSSSLGRAQGEGQTRAIGIPLGTKLARVTWQWVTGSAPPRASDEVMAPVLAPDAGAVFLSAVRFIKFRKVSNIDHERRNQEEHVGLITAPPWAAIGD